MSAARAPRVAVAPIDGSLVVSVVRFCRLLKRWGLQLAADSAQTALHALATIEITRRYDFRITLRVALLKRPEDFQLFDYLFNAFWSIDARKAAPTPQASERAPPEQGDHERAGDGDVVGDDVDLETIEIIDDPTAGQVDSQHLLKAAKIGITETVRPRSRAPIDLADLDRVAKALEYRLANRRSRRYERHPHGHRLDPRGTLRQSLRYGGIPLDLAWRRPQLSRTRMLIFCDVSRSMTDYSALLLRFAAAALRHVWRVEVFLFASELKRVTDFWRDKKWDEIESAIPACGGGTQVGACLETFFRDYDRCLTGSHSTTIILSDGLDAGEPSLITTTMRKLQRQSRVVWLNPLLRLEGYEPTARGMAAALAFVDVFAPAHDVASLWALVEILSARGARGDQEL